MASSLRCGIEAEFLMIDPMNNHMRHESLIAFICVLLLPLWVWVTGLNSNHFWYVVLSFILGIGIGCGISGVRRGETRSRTLAKISLVILLLFAAGFTLFVATEG
jgi:hypothetical protein